jgi:nitroreductase
MAQSLRRQQEAQGTVDEAQVEKARSKPLRAPVIIVSAAVPSDAPKVIEIEEVAATAAATENLLLAAQALGLGAMWRTGAPAYDPAVKRFLGLPERAHIVGFIYVGYPDLPELPPRARSALDRTTWRGWDESDSSVS